MSNGRKILVVDDDEATCDLLQMMLKRLDYEAVTETSARAALNRIANEEFTAVLTDLDNGYALSLNLAIWLGSEIQRLLSYQDMAGFHGNDGWVLPIPATFVVGRDGLVKARFVDPDFRKRMEIDDLIAALQSASEER